MKQLPFKKKSGKNLKKFNKGSIKKLLYGWDCIAAFRIAFVIDVTNQ